MIVATRGRNHATFTISRGYSTSDEYGPFLSPISLPDTGLGVAGPIGLTAVAAAIRLVSETIACFVMRAYKGDATHRQPQLDAPQAGLFQAGSDDGYTSFNLWEDVCTQGEVYGNALIYKERLRVGGKVESLFAFPVETAYIYRNRETGRKTIEATINGEKVDITRDVIHVRGWTPFADCYGYSTLSLHKRALAGSTSLEMFKGRFFDADATPSLLLSHPGSPTKPQRDELRESWKARHAGPGGEKVGVLWGGMTAQQLSSTLSDSQVAELSDADVMQVARMFRIFPAFLLAGGPIGAVAASAENTSDLFLRFSLLSRIRRIERALSSDRDIFDDRSVYANFDTLQFTRGDIATTASKLHMLKQVGLYSANEGRAELGLPPSTAPGADDLQQTPVGGAPNAEQLELPAGFAHTNGDAP